MSEAKIQDPFDEVSQRAAELAASDEGVTEESGAHPSVAHIFFCEGVTEKSGAHPSVVHIFFCEGVTEKSGAHPSVVHICEGFTDSPFYRDIRRST